MAIYPPGNNVPRERTVFGSREDASFHARSMIDAWLKKQRASVTSTRHRMRRDWCCVLRWRACRTGKSPAERRGRSRSCGWSSDLERVERAQLIHTFVFASDQTVADISSVASIRNDDTFGKPICAVTCRLHSGAGACYHHCPAVGTGCYELAAFHAYFPIMKPASVILGETFIEQHRKSNRHRRIRPWVREWRRGHDKGKIEVR
jgi:hypothetical protein